MDSNRNGRAAEREASPPAHSQRVDHAPAAPAFFEQAKQTASAAGGHAPAAPAFFDELCRACGHGLDSLCTGRRGPQAGSGGAETAERPCGSFEPIRTVQGDSWLFGESGGPECGAGERGEAANASVRPKKRGPSGPGVSSEPGPEAGSSSPDKEAQKNLAGRRAERSPGPRRRHASNGAAGPFGCRISADRQRAGYHGTAPGSRRAVIVVLESPCNGGGRGPMDRACGPLPLVCVVGRGKPGQLSGPKECGCSG